MQLRYQVLPDHNATVSKHIFTDGEADAASGELQTRPTQAFAQAHYPYCFMQAPGNNV
jgi:hypothetical protein